MSIQPYPKTQLEQGNTEYAKIEERAQLGEQVEAVLVSSGPVEALKNAYPNYFLDSHQFVVQVGRVIAYARKPGALRKRARRAPLN